MTISLEKRTADAEASVVSLLKRQADKGIDLGELVAQVEIAIDFSGSMRARYKNGEVQTVVERALALSLCGLDDDGVVPVHFFDHQDYPAELVDASNYAGFVDAWWTGKHMGATNYAPTIRNILAGTVKKRRFGKPKLDVKAEQEAPPKFIIFVTDGAPSDKGETTRLLVQASSRPIFWQFIGLGYSPKFLRKLDDMGGRTVDNVGLVEYDQTHDMTDTQFFDSVIGEFFTSWLPEARRLGITHR